jgi:hypothetical protein
MGDTSVGSIDTQAAAPQPTTVVPESDVDSNQHSTTAVSSEDETVHRENARRRLENKELKAQLAKYEQERADAEQAKLKAEGKTQELLELATKRAEQAERQLQKRRLKSKAVKALAKEGVTDPDLQKMVMDRMLKKARKSEKDERPALLKKMAKKMAKKLTASQPEPAKPEKKTDVIVTARPRPSSQTENRTLTFEEDLAIKAAIHFTPTSSS